MKQDNVLKNEKIVGDDDENTGNHDNSNIYEQYDGDYAAYNHRYANYSKMPESNCEIILRFAKKKWAILLVISLLSIVGIAVGLSVHFMVPEPLQSTTTFQGILIEPSHTIA